MLTKKAKRTKWCRARQREGLVYREYIIASDPPWRFEICLFPWLAWISLIYYPVSIDHVRTILLNMIINSRSSWTFCRDVRIPLKSTVKEAGQGAPKSRDRGPRDEQECTYILHPRKWSVELTFYSTQSKAASLASPSHELERTWRIEDNYSPYMKSKSSSASHLSMIERWEHETNEEQPYHGIGHVLQPPSRKEIITARGKTGGNSAVAGSKRSLTK